MKNTTPRRKRMKRQARLQSAKSWLTTYTGRNIIKGYKKWFGVDLECAIKELKLLEVKLDEQYIENALKSKANMLARRKQKKYVYNEMYDSDENFYYIAGYTSSGFPYGVTWEEMNVLASDDET